MPWNVPEVAQVRYHALTAKSRLSARPGASRTASRCVGQLVHQPDRRLARVNVTIGPVGQFEPVDLLESQDGLVQIRRDSLQTWRNPVLLA
jgi:hypothetical protein